MGILPLRIDSAGLSSRSGHRVCLKVVVVHWLGSSRICGVGGWEHGNLAVESSQSRKKVQA